MKVLKEIVPYIIIILVVVLIRTFIITPVRVKGDSMVPTLKNGEILLLQKWKHNFKRFDIVVASYDGTRLVKRVIGLPGDHILYQDGNLYVNDKKVKENFKHGATDDFQLEELGYDTIPEDYYLILGDNRTNSTDGRILGLMNKKELLGKTGFVIFPFNQFGSKK